MKRGRLICLMLTICIVFSALPMSFALSDVTLTAINDTFLPLSDSTMPTRKGGTQYVPYTVFSGTLGISGAYQSSQQTLTLSNGSASLIFDLSKGTVFDQNQNSYATPAYWIHGTVYVPVKLVCGKFDLTYSNITASVPILRICNQQASLSDSAFVSSSASTIEKMVEAYTQASAPPTPPAVPEKPAPIDSQTGTSVPLEKPAWVYLAYLGTPNENTDDILQQLAQAEQTATFFLSADGTALDGDLLRQIVAQGHTIGFVLLSSAQDMPEKLRAANDILFAETGTISRLVCISDGSAHLSQAQKEALQGYRIWDAPLDSRDHSYSASQATHTVASALSQQTAPTVIRMGHYDTSARTTALILSYLQTYSIPIRTISLATAPILS